MIRVQWLRQYVSAVCAGVGFVLALTLLQTDALHAQSPQLAVTRPGTNTIAPSNAPRDFLVAPSISLGYSPTSIAVGHLTSTGGLDVITADASTGILRVYHGAGAGTFSAPLTYSGWAHPSALAIADMDADGKADVIVASESDRTISILPGNGDGTLGQRVTFTVGFAPSLLALGDFSGSGRLDVAVAGGSTNSLAVLLNDGTGNLKPSINLALSAIPASVTTADFDHDGHLDLAFGNSNGTVSVLLGRGNGQFTPLPDLRVTSGSLSSIIAADFNNDGEPDLAVTSTNANQVAIITGQGNGKFSTPTMYQVGNGPVALHVADLNQDGIPDVVVINRDSNTFTVLTGAGDSTFKSPLHFVVGNSPIAAAFGDFRGNGKVTLATIDQLSRTLTLPPANGDGTFAAGRVYGAGTQPVAVGSGDLDRDGHADIVTADYCDTDATCGGGGSAAVLLADSVGGYRLSSTYVMGAGTVSLALIDVSGDKNLDLVALNRSDRSVSVRLGRGDGSFGDLVTIPLSAAPVALASGDFKGNHRTDLAILEDCGSSDCSQPGQVEMLLGEGDGNFRSESVYTAGYSPVGLTVGATRTGGKLDLLVANRCGQDPACQSGGSASIFYGNGTGGFARGKEIALGNNPSALALADISGSGEPDLIVSRATENTVAVLPGKGNGSFGSAVTYPVGSKPGSLAIADFNGDGISDLAVANAGDSTVSVLLGSVGGVLRSAGNLPVGGNPSSIAAVTGIATRHASLATTSGAAGSSATGAALTVVSNVVPATIGTGVSTTTLTAKPTTSSVNPSSLVNLAVAVTGIPSTGTPTGTVDITSNGTPVAVCSALALDTSGAASCDVASLEADVTTLTATYNGDQAYATSTGTATVKINPVSPSVTVTASPVSPQPLNTAVTFTATLSGITITPTAPGGTMTFDLNGAAANCIGGNNVVTVDPKTGSATCQIQDMPTATTNKVTASYSGNSNFKAATVTSAAYTITALQPTFTISASPSSTVAVGTPVNFTATLSGVAFSPVPPNGKVAFTLNGSSVSGCTAVSITGEAASCSMNSLVSPADTITATYSGDSNFKVASAATFTETVTAAAPTIVLTSSANPSSVNQSITLKAVVPAPAGQNGKPFPTGSVTFTQGANTLCGGPQGLSTPTPPLSPTNQPAATCSTTFSTASTFPILATYSGDQNFSAGTPGSLSQLVNADATTTTLISSGAATINGTVTFTPTVTASNSGTAIPQGTVSFTVQNATPTGTCSTGVTLSSTGVAPSCTYTFAGAGTFNVTAKFTPSDSNFATSTSSAFAQRINPGSVAINLSSGLNPSTVNQPVGFTAAFSAINGTQPNGTMTFTDSLTSATLCRITVTSGSSSACTAPFASAGAHTVVATFTSSDNNFNGTTSNVITQTVNQTSTTAVVVSATPSSSVNQSVTFTATVASSISGTASPKGTVTFNSSLNGQTAVLCGSARPVSTSAGTSTATCSAPFAATGSYSISASYSGDGNFVNSASAAITQTVGTASTSLSVTGPSTNPSVNQAVTYTATIAPGATGALSPTGTITFTDSVAGTQLCLPAIVTANGKGGGSGSCAVSFLAAGSHTLTATYSGDGNFSGNAGTAAVQVQQTATALTVTPSINPTVATAAVTFVSVVKPSIAGGASPGGTVTFTSTDGTLNTCKAVPLTQVSGTATASCAVAFPHTPTLTNGQIGVTAVYSGDANFTTNSAGQTITETVQDFNVVLTVKPISTPGSTNVSGAQGVYVTQGYSNSTDLFNPASITAVVTSSGGFNPSLSAACAVINTSTNQPVTDPSCSVASTLPGTSGTSITLNLKASPKAPVGTYSVALTASDSAVALSLTTNPALTLNVLGASGSLALATGAQGSVTAQFNTGNTANGTTLASFSCPQIWDTTKLQMDDNAHNSLIGCTGPSGAVTTTDADTQVAIAITASNALQAMLDRANSLQLAGIVGLPFLTLMGWFGTKGSRRRNLLRLFSVVFLAFGISCAIGCGSSFGITSSGNTSSGIGPGTYLVEVVATDSSGKKYYSVVQLVVNSLNGQ
jgi:hypothetical protein